MPYVQDRSAGKGPPLVAVQGYVAHLVHHPEFLYGPRQRLGNPLPLRP